jgi:CRISPR-associated endonuclease/helicase Cas3
MMLLAHSANAKKGVPGQGYAAHVCRVVSRAEKAANSASMYSPLNGELLQTVVKRAAEFHDLGKLDEENQKVLAGVKKAKSLPVQHTDAGTAWLLKEGGIPLDAILVRSHHIGLPDFIDESNRPEDSMFRDEKVRQHVDCSIKTLLMSHTNAIVKSLSELPVPGVALKGNSSLFFRIALSCLADADHTDTSIHYKEYPEEESVVELKPALRLKALDIYAATLGKTADDRSLLRGEMYRTCRDSIVVEEITSCDSPVGTGKTTAVMAHLLTQAENRNLRRVIVVLPFTNIISQSVQVYRKALVLPGENPEMVVAELHHRADFQDINSRHLTALWKAPIIVTTAVTFFETLASNTPSTLRRLHNLPGSGIFIDESHAALPAKLLPIAWEWIKGYSTEWGCYWVLASGSLNRFWQIPEIDEKPPDVPEVIPDGLRTRLANYESRRITYRYKTQPQSADGLVSWFSTLPGPRIVILNTVQSAAAVALTCKERFGRESVEHLSTALTPTDRTRTLERVKERLRNSSDIDWTLVATSCVEAGVDISFRTGARELGSLVSLLQTAGRVNRHGINNDAEVWTVRLAEAGLLKLHPGLKDASQVLQDFFDSKKIISPELCTEALKREIRLAGTDLCKLHQMEKTMRFPQVEKGFHVIAGDTRAVVVEKSLIERLEGYEPVAWQDIQEGSVQIWGYRLEALQTPEFTNHPGVYRWNLLYDDFIGYMAGILQVEAFTKSIDGACIL